MRSRPSRRPRRPGRRTAPVVTLAGMLVCFAIAAGVFATSGNQQGTGTGTAGDPAGGGAGTGQQSTVPDDAGASPSTAAAQLATLAVKGRAPKTGYDRVEDFGSAWLDVDGNGCDTRNDILARDLTAITRSGACTVLSGTLADPYTGTSIAFVRGVATSTAVQIDHVVALMDAWQSGAQQLSTSDREQLANDPLNLMAVDGPSNSRKSASNAASWLPANRQFWCEYVARQVSVKAAYGLWVTVAEHDAIARVLAACPEEPAVARSGKAAESAGAAQSGN